MKSIDIYDLFEAQQTLLEVEMSPSNLKKLAKAIKDVKVGMEFEMVVPDAHEGGDDEDNEGEEDLSINETAYTIDQICDFYSQEDENWGRRNERSDINYLRATLHEKYMEYIDNVIDEDWRGLDGREYFSDWLKKNVDPDEVSMFADKGTDLLGDYIRPDDEDWENFAEAEWQNQDSYYDQALDDFQEMKRSDEDFDEEEFLRSIGIRDMEDVQSVLRTGLQWPVYTYTESGYGDSIEQVADEFSDAIGKRVNYSTEYHGARRLPDGYTVEPDTSINHPSDAAGLEFISYPMPVEDMFEDLAAIKKWADSRGCYTNRSTGLHMNVSVPNYAIDDLDYVKLAILLGDKYVLDQFNRYGSNYAESALDIIKQKARPAEVEKLLTQLKTNMENIASKILHSGHTGKFTSINTKDKYVEFRSPGGDWLDENFNKIENTLLRFIVALDAACDPNKYKNEYVKGLYKLLKPKDGKNDMSLMARYMAGELNVSDYASILEDKRKSRFQKEGIVVLYPDEVEEDDWKVTYTDGQDVTEVYFANTPALETEEQVYQAAKRYKPNLAKRSDINIERYHFDEKYKDLHIYKVEYGHKVQSVVAKNPEEAKETIRIMDPDYFFAYPQPTLFHVEDTGETSLRKISEQDRYQEDKLKRGREWIARPKLWYAYSRHFKNSDSRRYYIAAVSREDALNVLDRLEGEDVEGTNLPFELGVTDAYVDTNTYEAHEKAQNDMIQAREEREARQREQEQHDISNLKTYRVHNMNGYKYIVAENGAEAAEIANKIDPDTFPNIEEITTTDASSLTSTSSPSIMRSMYQSQLEKLRELEQSTPDQYSVYDARNARNEGMFIAARTPVEAHTIAARLYPDTFTDEIRTTRYGDATRMDAERLLRQQAQREQELRQSGTINIPAEFNEPSSSRISDMQSYLVTNVDTGDSRYFAATDMQQAIDTARRSYPALFPRDAGLYARPHEPGQR